MNMPGSDVGHMKPGVSWRMRRPEHEGVAGVEDTAIIELVDTMGNALAAVALPAQEIEDLLRPHLSFFADLRLDGSLSMDAEFLALLPPPSAIDLLELVKSALTPEMLEDEPKAKEQLAKLRQRLTEALALVDQTLAGLVESVP